jgi:glutathione S-transferase
MKLFYSPTSPYARKCRIVAIERGLEQQVEIVNASPLSDPPDLQRANPLGKVPALVLADGRCIVDSPVICEFLDGIGASAPLIPRDLTARIEARTREALADGIMDAAFNLTMEKKRPEPQRSPEWIGRWTGAIRRSVAHFNAAQRPAARFDLGDITLACALGYLDLRHGDLAWRSEAPALASWFAATSERYSLSSTVPPA